MAALYLTFTITMDPIATYYIFDKWQRNILLKAKTYLTDISKIAEMSFMQPWGSIVLVICQIAKDALLKQKVEMVTAILIIWPFTR